MIEGTQGKRAKLKTTFCARIGAAIKVAKLFSMLASFAEKGAVKGGDHRATRERVAQEVRVKILVRKMFLRES
jgi:hypothetical protein